MPPLQLERSWGRLARLDDVGHTRRGGSTWRCLRIDAAGDARPYVTKATAMVALQKRDATK
jgi:hypothetical protein